jgi:hypothetical protein
MAAGIIGVGTIVAEITDGGIIGAGTIGVGAGVVVAMMCIKERCKAQE